MMTGSGNQRILDFSAFIAYRDNEPLRLILMNDRVWPPWMMR
jgi:hypothetical protein